MIQFMCKISVAMIWPLHTDCFLETLQILKQAGFTVPFACMSDLWQRGMAMHTYAQLVEALEYGVLFYV